MIENEFEKRVAVVTGASSGIGYRLAVRLAAAGASVVAVARSRDRLEALAVSGGGRIAPVTGDVSDPATVERVFSVAEEKFGPCDMLVNNAGMVDPKLLTEVGPADWDRMFAVNVRSAYLAARRALPAMIAARRGVIVNVASISGVPGPQKFPGFVSYCASKAALIGFTEALAAEVREHGVRVNAVSPGSVDTPMLKQASESLLPDMTPDEVVTTILFLGSDRSRPINGQNIHVYSA